MKIKQTLVLIVILAVVIVLYLYDKESTEESNQQKIVAEKLFNFETDSVKGVDIREAIGQYVFEHDGENWQILKPLQTGADKSKISSMLSSLKNMKKISEFPVTIGDLPQFGLVGRSTLVILTFKDGTRDSVWFGDKTQVGDNVYTRKTDTLLYTAGSQHKQNAQKSLFDWRDKSVSKVKQSDVVEFKFRNSSGAFHFVREGANWQIQSPRPCKADNTPVNAILNKLERGIIKSVVEENLGNSKKYRLDNPRYKFDLYIGEAKAYKKVIFSSLRDNVAYGKDDGRPYVFSVDSLFIKDLEKSLFDLRDKKMTDFARSRVDRIQITQGDSSFLFVKDTSDTWHYNGDQPLKQWKMNSMLSSVSGLKSKKFLLEGITSTNKYGFARPDRKIELFTGDSRIQEISLNSGRDDQKIAFCPQTGIVAEIETSVYNNMEVKLSDYLEEQKTETEGE